MIKKVTLWESWDASP